MQCKPVAPPPPPLLHPLLSLPQSPPNHTHTHLLQKSPTLLSKSTPSRHARTPFGKKLMLINSRISLKLETSLTATKKRVHSPVYCTYSLHPPRLILHKARTAAKRGVRVCVRAGVVGGRGCLNLLDFPPDPLDTKANRSRLFHANRSLFLSLNQHQSTSLQPANPFSFLHTTITPPPLSLSPFRTNSAR